MLAWGSPALSLAIRDCPDQSCFFFYTPKEAKMIPEVDPRVLSGYCCRCGVPVIAAGDPSDTSPMVCEHCAEGGHPGIRGHALPDYALAWAYARDECSMPLYAARRRSHGTGKPQYLRSAGGPTTSTHLSCARVRDRCLQPLKPSTPWRQNRNAGANRHYPLVLVT